MEIKIKKLHPDAMIPKYATEFSACFDLCALLKEGDTCTTICVSDDSPAIFRTGLSFEIPRGHSMLIFSRSGHGFNHDIRLANCVGVIDSDYRGEVKVKLSNDDVDGGWLSFTHGDRIAQAMIIPVPDVNFIEVDDLTETERGAGGFGSTGAQ